MLQSVYDMVNKEKDKDTERVMGGGGVGSQEDIMNTLQVCVYVNCTCV